MRLTFRMLLAGLAMLAVTTVSAAVTPAATEPAAAANNVDDSCYTYLQTKVTKRTVGGRTQWRIQHNPAASCIWTKFDLRDDGKWTRFGSMCVYERGDKNCTTAWDLKGKMYRSGDWQRSTYVYSSGTHRVCNRYSVVFWNNLDGARNVFGGGPAERHHSTNCRNVYVS